MAANMNTVFSPVEVSFGPIINYLSAQDMFKASIM